MPAIVFVNCALIINRARGAITIEKDPNFDDMLMVVDGVRQASYALPAGRSAYVGATYSETGDIVYTDDMGLSLSYETGKSSRTDERFMEIGVQDGGEVFGIIQDSEKGDDNAPLRCKVSGQSPNSITLTFFDR